MPMDAAMMTIAVRFTLVQRFFAESLKAVKNDIFAFSSLKPTSFPSLSFFSSSSE